MSAGATPAVTTLAVLLALLLLVGGVSIYCAEQTRFAVNEIKRLEYAIVNARDAQDTLRFRLADDDNLLAVERHARQQGLRYPPL